MPPKGSVSGKQGLDVVQRGGDCPPPPKSRGPCLQTTLPHAPSQSDKQMILINCYRQFADIVMQVDLLRMCDFPAPLLTRPSQCVNEMVSCFEQLRMFSDYRTPASIRSFCRLTTVMAALFTGPYFAHIMDSPDIAAAQYGMFLLISFFWLVGCMANIQVCCVLPDESGSDDGQILVR